MHPDLHRDRRVPLPPRIPRPADLRHRRLRECGAGRLLRLVYRRLTGQGWRQASGPLEPMVQIGVDSTRESRHPSAVLTASKV